jgi:hypothetical protein
MPSSMFASKAMLTFGLPFRQCIYAYFYTYQRLYTLIIYLSPRRCTHAKGGEGEDMGRWMSMIRASDEQVCAAALVRGIESFQF